MREARHDPLLGLVGLLELSLDDLAELDDDTVDGAVDWLLPEYCATAPIWENNRDVFPAGS
jgi:hypothetical protein